MEQVTIQKDTVIEGLFKDYESRDLEDRSIIEVVSSGNLKEGLDKFEKYLKGTPLSILNSDKDPIILEPCEISRFVLGLKNYEGHHLFNLSSIKFINLLISNSYEAGNNDFNFNTRNILSSSSCLGKDLSGSKENRLKISIVGDIGFNSFSGSKYVDLVLEGNMRESFGYSSESLHANIYGDVGYSFGEGSTDLVTSINGDVEDSFGLYSKNLTAMIKGKVENLFGGESNNLFAKIDGDIDYNIGFNSVDMVAILSDEVRADGYNYLPSHHKNLKLILEIDARSNSVYLQRLKQLEEVTKWLI